MTSPEGSLHTLMTAPRHPLNSALANVALGTAAACKASPYLQADLAAWFREVHALWLGRGLYAELRVADVVQEVRLAGNIMAS